MCYAAGVVTKEPALVASRSISFSIYFTWPVRRLDLDWGGDSSQRWNIKATAAEMFSAASEAQQPRQTAAMRE